MLNVILQASGVDDFIIDIAYGRVVIGRGPFFLIVCKHWVH